MSKTQVSVTGTCLLALLMAVITIVVVRSILDLITYLVYE